MADSDDDLLRDSDEAGDNDEDEEEAEDYSDEDAERSGEEEEGSASGSDGGLFDESGGSDDDEAPAASKSKSSSSSSSKGKKDKAEKAAKKDKKDKKRDKEDKKKRKQRDSESKSSKSKSKKPRLNVRSFFLDEAQEAEDDEEEEEEEDEFVSEKERREITQAEADAIAKHARRQAMNQAFETKTAAEIAEEIKNRYRTSYQARGEYFEGARSEFAASEVTQKSLVPGVGDPTVWMLRCKPGLEMQLVRSILLKSLKLKSMGKRVGLKSAFCGNSKGYIYLEAFEEVSVREAIQGLTSLYHSSLKIVPIQQMTSLLTITVKKRALKAGQWVRIKRGELKGDLAKVLSVNEGGEMAVIQAIPRVDFTANTNKAPGTKAARPLQAPFDPSRVNSSLVERRQFPPTGETCNYYDRNFYKNGFLLKEVKIDLYLSDENVSPKLEELTMFRQQSSKKSSGGSDDEADAEEQEEAQQPSVVQELAALQAADSAFGLSKKQVSLYRPGDLVQIVSGELRNMVGRIISLSDTDRIVRVKPLHEVDLGEMDVEMDLIVKYIRPGSHVKVIDGEFVGQTGRVVCINKVDGSHIAALFTDVVNKEISVNVAHLQVSNEVTIGLNSLEGYELYDFVTLNANEVGVVVMVGTEKLSIVNHLGELKVVSPMEVRGKANIQSMRATSIDNMMEVMHVGDSVTVMEGPHAKKTGTIKHIYKSTVWLHCDTYFANAGIFPVRGRSCALAGGNRNASNGSMGPPTSMPRGRPTGGKNGGKDEIIGASVTISKGAYKGHIAVVREATDTDYTLELATKLKIIKLPKESVVLAGNKTGPLNRQAPTMQLGIAATPHLGSQTPSMGSSTPSMSFLGSETPLNFGNETPRGSETPSGGYGFVDVWRPHESDIAQSRAGSGSGSGPAMSPGAGSVAGLFAPPTPSGGSSLSHYDWDRPMLVTFSAGSRTGQTGVLRGKVNTRDGTVELDILDYQRRRTGEVASAHFSEVRPMVVAPNQRAMVVSGQKAGITGTVVRMIGADVVLNTAERGAAPKLENFKLHQIALVYDGN